MEEKKKIVRIFNMKQSSDGCSCSGNSCCSPVGLSEKDELFLKQAIEALEVKVEISDVKDSKNLQDHPEALKLYRSFGPGTLPIITVGNEVVCVGRSLVNEIVAAVKGKL